MMKAYFYEKDNAIYFYLEKESRADKGCEPFIFDGLATKGHKEEYKGLFEDFLRQQILAAAIEPDFKEEVKETVIIEIPEPIVPEEVLDPIEEEKVEEPKTLEEMPELPKNSTDIN
jgi:hypothetical protein